MLLRAARLPEGGERDLLIEGGLVRRVAPPWRLPPGPPELDLTGHLLLPAPAEPHAHLDKAMTFDAAGAPGGGLPAAVGAWRVHAARITEADVEARARRAVDELLLNGVTAVRTHADLLPGADPLRGIRALLRVREAVRGRMDLQLAVLHPEAPESVLRGAFELGADLLGGCPHLAPDPAAAVARGLRLAEEFGVGLDLHADENLDPASADLRLLAAALGRRPFPGRVTASHCVSLGALPAEEAARLAKEVAGAGIGVVTLPQTNLYLQGRAHPGPVPRGLPALGALLDAGVTLAAGGDNVRDPFNAVGGFDPLETASLLVSAGHLSPREALRAVTDAAREVLGLPPAGPFPGAVADLLAVRAGSLVEALGAACAERLVLRAGRPVARTTVRRELL
ncbi:cytosine deaminase [Streptomyces hoynatensis]|uniref:Cytosine deaminase n=1 Tax=Streptomyces hoynatensis TaxID=1141874 RepID=A0A3A9YPE4_9ACTN|nr:cytosine deaminase [Streptomyces hoynatensis]